MADSLQVDLGAATLAVERSGRGPAVVFLHAGVADRRMWAAQIAHFRVDYTAIAYDRRGFGETTARDQPFLHRDDLLVVLDHLEIEHAVFCGCSQGARIAIDFALAYPARARALILVGASYSGADRIETADQEVGLTQAIDQAEAAGNLDLVNELEAQSWLDGPGAEAGRVGEPLRTLFLSMNGIALAAPELTREQEPPSAAQRLSQLRCPTLLIDGDLDFEMIARHHETLHAQIAGSVRLTMPGTAHLPSMEQPDEFNAHVRGFLSSI
jgi:pimeloyl-ACP methyl ester carboxylesterase